MNETIFRKYDIRGLADTDLTDEVVELIGRAYAEVLGAGKNVVVGYDARESSERLFNALTGGLRRGGVSVIKLGMVPTPLVYFANFTDDNAHGAIQITGSHNPAEYNGFKMMMGKETLHGDGIQALLNIIKKNAFIDHAPDATTMVERTDLKDGYLAWMMENVQRDGRKLKVVLDSGNGVAGVIAPRVINEVFGGEVIELFSEPDAAFPNHHPDPTVEKNLQHLIAAVKEHGADLGVAYDGDGDRIGVVDERGDVIWGDKLMILLSREVLKEHPCATIIGEVKCSQSLFDDVKAHGGEPIMSAVGHSLIKAKIKETGAKLAGEMSGHIFFNDRYFGFDDAIYATCRVMEILASTSEETKLSQLLSDIPETFATPELRVDCEEDVKFELPGKVAEHFATKGLEVNTIDGARVHFAQGWGLVRASNTQPVLVMRVEAATEELKEDYLQQLKDALEASA